VANFEGSTVVEYARYLGLVDEDDATNLPNGCAAVAQNVRFTLTSVETRFGLQLALQGKNKSPITGLLGCAFTPEAASQAYFQAMLLFDMTGSLMIENPAGTGRTQAIAGGLTPPPANSHMIGTQCYNRAWMSFSNLTQPTAFCNVYDLFLKAQYPYGMKPVGFGWYAGAQVLAGECVCPSQLQQGVTVAVGNGHLYICVDAGTTGNVQPTWPLTEGGMVMDGTVLWKEQTPVLANRLPNPNAPGLIGIPSGGTIPAGLDIYAIVTLVNAQGESIASLPALYADSNLDDGLGVGIPALTSLPGWVQGLPSQYIPTGAQIYIASVPHGQPAPYSTAYSQVPGGPFALGSTQNLTALPASGINPPTTNSARITGGMIPAPDTEPVITRSSGAGAFPAGRDVYVIQTYTNKSGETTPGPANSIIDTLAADAVVVNVAGLPGYDITSIGIYECDVPTGTTFGGSEFPPFAQFALVGYYQPGATPSIFSAATGAAPPVANTTGTEGNIAQDTFQGGVNSTQGYRCFSICFEDLFDTISGFTQASVFQYDVDENGWEISVFNLPKGPSYIQNVIVDFSVADGTSAGPFYYIPNSYVSDGIPMTATVVANGVSSATFNFTDEYLVGSLDVTDRLRVIQPQQCVDIYYSPATNRIFQTGVPGFYSGHWVSLAADVESYYGDTGLITVGFDDGERAICVREYQGTVYSLRERSGYIISPSTGDPSTWSVTNRWTKVGPCGPRAVDVCGQFMIFVHSSGIYKYEDVAPELVSKEIRRWWNIINWQAQQNIWCAIDVEQHEIRFGFPVGNSTVPNLVLTLNYEEGWNDPLLFSRYSGKEITVEQARKYSVDNIQGYLGGRYYRTVTGQPTPVEGPVDTEEQISRQYISQFLIASSGPDGSVQAVTPGVYNDNGAGIDSRYESIASQEMMSLCKLHGINANARGNGQLFPYFVAGTTSLGDWSPGTNPQAPQREPVVVKLRPWQLELNPTKGLTRMTPSRLSERWRPGYSNGAIADAWFALKYSSVFLGKMFDAREVSENP
jgi:hypothetical protein